MEMSQNDNFFEKNAKEITFCTFGQNFQNLGLFFFK